ncbi:hypothetical protein CJD36_016850 [Flavipsychrobacter stenotrophus]|uniref:Core-binding (CB) domain-containing protein n=1 Tax=Flavipsychrobacter stenotrophus TaxID=2077091 RepID=A0A2S7SSB6_9BACT|nr:hypothetical protein [Flavipsychrobacter stenotrophus]PQJ09608.1 hypothetical protein CJD36_016850 [Flavipsychrobacter stenotrophus]
MNHEESFKEWLPHNRVHGKSIGSYASYLKSLEKALGASIDNLLKPGLESALEKINSKVIPGRPENTLIKYRTALKKYSSFLNKK